MRILCTLFILLATHCFADKSVFMGMIIKNNDAMLPYFLKTIDRLDYNKKAINLQVDVCNNTQEVKELVKEWCTSRKNLYANIECHFHLIQDASIKNDYLKNCKECDFCFIVPSDAFLKPFTLKQLLCNEREFGVFMHVDNWSLEEEKTFNIPGTGIDENEDYLCIPKNKKI